MFIRRRLVLGFFCASLGIGSIARAQTGDLQAPKPPATISRSNGQVVVRAIHLTEPLVVDGKLDESVYRDNLPLDGFIQTVPMNGRPVSEKTEAWVMFDDEYIYVSAKLYDTAPPNKWIANELRRDTSQLRQNDMFGVLFDTFHDRRNGYNFYTNPLGGFTDQLVTDEGNPNADWNPVWKVHEGRFEGGWTTEMAIPFKSIRYVSGTNQAWGLQLRRSIRRKNEWAHLTALPAANGGPNSIFRISQAATLVGLDLPPQSKNVQLKPYLSTSNLTDRIRRPPVSSEQDYGWGGDAKYGITANLTADLTVRTDFAQVEVDEQQLNLTRFQLQFPEKRDFFLEGRGTFDFGRGSSSGGGGLGFGSGGNSAPSVNAPQLFYSRRIGLNNGRVIPIDVGGRLTGKVGKFSVGALNLQAAEEDVSHTPSTNFTVLRLRRDVLRRSVIGAMLTNRSQSAIVPGEANLAYGLDGNFNFFNDLTMSGYIAQSDTNGRLTDNRSYTGRFDFAPDRYGFRLDYLKVGANFTPEVGFANRTNFNRSFASARFSPRPRGSKRVRKYTWEGTYEYLENGRGYLETRNAAARFMTEFQNSDTFSIVAADHYERLVQPFTVSAGHTIPRGAYPFQDATITYGFGQQRRLSGSLALQAGEFYDGTIKALTYSTGRFAILKQWSLEPSFTINHVELPTAGNFSSQVYRARTDYGFSPRRFISGLLQYSSADHLFSSNFRYRWEYRPGSELFVVYTDERNTIAPGYPDLRNRAFVVKVTRLFQF